MVSSCIDAKSKTKIELMSSVICLPCAWQNGVSDYKKEKLINEAKTLAYQNNTYYSIIFDELDAEFEVMAYEEVKQKGLEAYILDTLSPFM
jgi:hypothetical protein